MARKNFLEGLNDVVVPTDQQQPSTYPMRGASKTMIRSLDDIAKQAEKFLEGEAIVELEPDQVEASFVSDRLDEDTDEFDALVDAIRSRGQDTPILVRPHPDHDGRYQAVFGHRRLRAAKVLGRKVRAVVKPLDDRTHVIAQGQENSARANLSFIERALFARRLQEKGYDRDVISTALSTNASSLSKMMSVTERISGDLIELIGAAPSVGRERWIELSLLVGKPSNAAKVDLVTGDGVFKTLASDERFSALFSGLNKAARPVRKTDSVGRVEKWAPPDKAVAAEIKHTGKAYSLSMKAKNASRFGVFLSSKLDILYAQFLEDEMSNGE